MGLNPCKWNLNCSVSPVTSKLNVGLNPCKWNLNWRTWKDIYEEYLGLNPCKWNLNKENLIISVIFPQD